MEWRCEDKDTNVKKINCKVVILTKFVKWVIKKKMVCSFRNYMLNILKL